MEEINNSPRQIGLPLVLCIGLAGGLLVGVSLNSTTVTGKSGDDVQKFREVLGLIHDEYVDTTQTEALVDDAIQHMLNKLDPHSSYIPNSQRIEANEDLQGNFEGIGIEFSIFHDTLVVVSALSGGPSEAVGLQPGDKIIKVGDKLIANIGLTNPQVMKLLKGPKGTEAKLEVLRKNSKEPIKFTIIRDKIPQLSVDASYMVEPGVGYIKINRFSQTTFEEFQAAMTKLKEQGMKKLVLDLQGNPGGYMNQAIDIADEFLSEGKKIVFTKGKDKKYNSEALATGKGDFEKGDTDILVGTQMVTKGLDFDRVNLVGVFDADRMMHFPDFRSYERSFQLIIQVSGRAGRREKQGKVIIQTSNPKHPLFTFVIEHNITGFLEEQLRDREVHTYPPYGRLIEITFKHTDRSICRKSADWFADNARKKLGGIKIMGPGEPMISKIRNEFLQAILLKIPRNQGKLMDIKLSLQLLADHITEQKEYRSVRVVFDVDPV